MGIETVEKMQVLSIDKPVSFPIDRLFDFLTRDNVSAYSNCKMDNAPQPEDEQKDSAPPQSPATPASPPTASNESISPTTPSTPSDTASTSGPAPKKKLSIKLIIGAIAAVVLLAVVAGIAYTQLIGPGQVKEKLTVGHPVYTDYEKAVSEAMDYLEDDNISGFDSDAIERAAQKEKTLLKTAEDTGKTLTSLLENQKKVSQLDKYNSHVEAYLEKSKEAVSLLKDSNAISNGFIRPIKEYEELTVAVSGASQYMYSNPTRYSQALDDAIEREEKIISSLKDIRISDRNSQDIVNVFVRTLENELELLKNMKTAVAQRDNDLISKAQQTYTKNGQELAKDASRISDNFKETLKELDDELEEIHDQVTAEYSNLQRRYNL